MRNCPEIICIFQGASRCPLPAASYPKAKPFMLLRAAGSGQLIAVSVASLKMWKLIKDNS